MRRLNAAVFLRESARLTRHAICGWLIAGLATSARAQKPPTDLTTTSLEELINTQVTSVSKKEQKLSRSAAAIYVITQEDIRRSGLTSIPELLRLDWQLSGRDELTLQGGLVGQRIPVYTWLDTRLGWRLTESLDFRVGAQNLLDNRHPGAGSLNQGVLASEVERSFYGKVTWRF